MDERLHANEIQNKLNNTTFIFSLIVKTKTALCMHFVDSILEEINNLSKTVYVHKFILLYSKCIKVDIQFIYLLIDTKYSFESI